MSDDSFAHVVSPESDVSKSGNRRTLIIVVSAVAAAVILIVGVVGTVWMLNRDGGGYVAAASTSPEPEPTVSTSPEPEPTVSPSPEPEPTVSPSPEPEPAVSPSSEPEPEPTVSPSSTPEPDRGGLARAEALGFTPVVYEMGIDEIHDYYSELRTSLELFQELIPPTEEGAEYVHAFMLMITDHKAAARFGATFDGEARDRLAALELQFLAVADMDVDIKITNTDGSVFQHDGTAPKH